MANLEISILKTLGHEGLYSNDPDDPGGETWRGIARKFHGEWVGWVSIDAAKARSARPETLKDDPALQAHVLSFYRREFAMPIYDQIANQEVLDELFDFGFNVNPPNAVRAVQEGLRGILAGPVLIDGVFGLQTLVQLNGADPRRFLEEFRARQGVYYIGSVVRRFTRALRGAGVIIPDSLLQPADKFAMKYALGWLRRVMA